YAGLNAGERVVTEGSLLLRAESLKLDSAQLTTSKAPSVASTQAAAQPTSRQAVQPSAQQTQVDQADAKPSQLSQRIPDRTQTVAVMRAEYGNRPDNLKHRKGIPPRVTFVPTAAATFCPSALLAAYTP